MVVPIFPPEIIREIVAHVASPAANNGVQDRRRYLAACCLVSHTFLRPARVALYRKIEVGILRPQGDAFGRIILDGIVSPFPGTGRSLDAILGGAIHLAALVRSLEFRFLDAPVRADNARGPRLADIFRSCPNIDEVAMVLGHWAIELREARVLFRLLKTTYRSPILGRFVMAMNSDPDSRRRAVPIDQILNLVAPHSTLTELELYENNCDFGGFSSSVTLTCPTFHLTSLSLRVHSHDILCKALAFLAPSSAQSLRHLKVNVGAEGLDLSPFVQLGTLSCSVLGPSQPSAVMPGLDDTLRSITSPAREHLEIVDMDPTPVPNHPVGSDTFIDALPYLPSSLRSLNISSIAIDVRSLLPHLASTTCDLRRIVVCQPTSSVNERTRKDVEVACGLRGTAVKGLEGSRPARSY